MSNHAMLENHSWHILWLNVIAVQEAIYNDSIPNHCIVII